MQIMNSRIFFLLRSIVPIYQNTSSLNQVKIFRHVQHFSSESPKQPVTKKLATPEFHNLLTPELQNLNKIFDQHNHELRIVGDPVLDLLLNKQPLSIDLASTATPEQIKTILSKEKILLLKSKGESHGSISLQIDEQPFKVSSLRTDTKSTGLNFTTDWYLDARRRDLTVGAMFLDLNGTLYDYFNGIDDVEKKRVRFVGNPAVRIREDYFRIMRYFRYVSFVAQDVKNLDPEILKAIKSNAKRLNEISGNKMWMELTKILSGNLKFDLMRKMLEIGMAESLGLPKQYNLEELNELQKRSARFSLHPITIIASLLKTEDDMTMFNHRMKLTKLERDMGLFVINHRNFDKMKDPLHTFRETLVLSSTNKSTLTSWMEQVLRYRGDEKMLKEFQTWEMPIFPIKTQQLLDYGIQQGNKLQVVMTAMKKRWLQSSFALTEEDLLAKLHEIVREVDERKSRTKTKGK